MPSDADFQSLLAQVSFLAARVTQLEATVASIQAGSGVQPIAGLETAADHLAQADVAGAPAPISQQS